MTKLIECDQCGKQTTNATEAYSLKINDLHNDFSDGDFTLHNLHLCKQCKQQLLIYIGLIKEKEANKT